MAKSFLLCLLAATFLAQPAARADSLLVPAQTLPAATEMQVVKPETTALDNVLPSGMQGKIPVIPFEDGTDRFELSGEDVSSSFTFVIGKADLAHDGALVISYQNATSVVPDESEMVIQVNGAKLGSIRIASPFGFTEERLAVPASYLKAGRNRVEIRTRQYHRVDCSLDATYELWTRINPQTSGFEPKTPVTFSGIEDLNRVGRMENGRTELRLVLPETATTDMLNDALPLLQAIALYLDRDDVVVTVASAPGDGAGIDVYVGSPEIGRQTNDAANILNGSPEGVSVRSGKNPLRAAVILRGGSRQSLEASLSSLIEGPMNDGLKSGVLSSHFGVIKAEAGESYQLRDAGIRSLSFSGRLMRQRFDLVLPADFYPAEYATLDLKLNAATSPGLEPSSQLLIRVNDNVVNSFPFRNTNGERYNGKLIELPLRAFRPGVNRVELLAELPTAADAACAPETRDDSVPRFILLDDSEIRVPPLARLSRLPDLAAFAGKAYPYDNGKAFTVYVDQPESQSISAAMTMIVRLAQSSTAPIKAELAFSSAPANLTGNALLVTATEKQASLPGKRERLVASNSFLVDENAGEVVRLDTTRTATINAIPANKTKEGAEADSLLNSFKKLTQTSSSQQDWLTRLRIFMSDSGSRFTKWLSYQSEEQETTLPEGGALVTLSQSLSSNGDSVLTIVAASTGRDLQMGVNRLVEPAVWHSLDGGAAVIAPADLKLLTYASTNRHVLEVTDQSLSNYRRIAAAWFSDNFRIYVLLVIAFAGLFAFWLGRIIPKLGVRSDQ